MQGKSWILLRVLMNRFQQKSSDTILDYLPEEDSKGVLAQTVTSNNPAIALLQPEEMLAKIHYSWMLSALKAIPEPIQNSILFALPHTSAAKLRQLLNLPPLKKGIKLASPVKTFLINTLYSHVKGHEILPLEFLPVTNLSPLATWTKQDIVQMVDLLSMFDLADEVRNIIDKDRLKKIYACITPSQQQFLRTCLHQKERIAASKLKLEQWSGDRKQLEKLLHRRGLIRLAKALSGQHPDFIWHISHTLDVGRGTLLLANYSKTATPQITPVLVQQVINLMNLILSKRTP